MLLAIALIIIVLCIIFLPQFWVKQVIKKYSQPIDALPGTGGELAQHLVKRFEMEGVNVETTENGNDHYDPESRTIRLSEEHFDAKSLAAITIAAHECVIYFNQPAVCCDIGKDTAGKRHHAVSRFNRHVLTHNITYVYLTG